MSLFEIIICVLVALFMLSQWVIAYFFGYARIEQRNWYVIAAKNLERKFELDKTIPIDEEKNLIHQRFMLAHMRVFQELNEEDES